jgi:NADP-dependent 3-hydroxy acid dehydrogenase YdfG
VQISGPVDMLVANAGLSIPKLFHDQTSAELEQMMDVNFMGCANAARAVLPLMKQQRAGTLVFVGSGMSCTAFAGYAGTICSCLVSVLFYNSSW